MDITSNSKIILYSSFNSIFSSKFCGSKAIDYLCSLDSGNLCIILKSDEVDSNIRVYEQIFRRLLKSVHDYHSNIVISSSSSSNNSIDGNISLQQQQQRSPLQLYILLEEERSSNSAAVSSLEDHTNDDLVAVHYNKVLYEFLSTIWTDDYVRDNFPSTTAIISSLSDVLQLNIVPVKQSELSTIVNANAIFTNSNYPVSSSSSSIVRHQIAPLLYSKWKSISSELHPILSNLQKQSLYKIELAYVAGLTQADIIISQWQNRVTSGKIIGKFATRLSELLLNIKNDYNKNVISNINNKSGSSIIRERSERLKLLNDYILIAGERLFRQQIIIIEYVIINKFRDNLLLLLQSNNEIESNVDDNDSSNNLRESEQNLLRKCIFEYKTKISDLEDEKLNLILTEEKVNEFTTILTTVLSEFPESSIAKLSEIKKIEKQMKKKSKGNNSGRGRKRKGIAKLLGVSFQLVGMLRPPGFGNLQGYIGYASSLLGFPLDLLLGIQNDGDSPEVRIMMLNR